MQYLEAKKLSVELQKISRNVPHTWGRIQNNEIDNEIDLFNCHTFAILEEKTKNKPIAIQIYFKRRWFLWQCSKVDEFLFYNQETVQSNPNPKDQAWDIKFLIKNNSFDLKSTRVPKKIQRTFNTNQEEELIYYYYKHQSKQKRFREQNRLFIVQHSFVSDQRTNWLRCQWATKQLAYLEFTNRLNKNKLKLITYKNAHAKCIFILERKENEISFEII